MTILDDIAERTKTRIAQDKQNYSLQAIRSDAEAIAQIQRQQAKRQQALDQQALDQQTLSQPKSGFLFPFEAALRRPSLSFICEIKKASPSKGVIAEDFPYLQIALDYEAAGADAISCLTEPYWFLGKDEYLREVTEAVSIPLLRKDFTVDEYMIYQAKVLGASAVLLICSILSDSQLKDYAALAQSLGLSALVETHDEGEIERALKMDASIIGINNRNLKDFSVDFNNTARLRKTVPAEVLLIAESGVTGPDDIAALTREGVDGVLVGEALMRSADKAATLREFRKAAESAAPKMRPRIKFCGLSHPEDVDAANAVKPDYAGFVFWDRSSRRVDADEAAALREILDDAIVSVGVFVDADPSFIAQLAHGKVISVAQLHGSEDAAYIAKLRELAPELEIWKAILVKSKDDLARAEASTADEVLLDANLGGGECFNWSLLDGIKRPFMLAGGLNPENVSLALEHLNPLLLDVSSGIEDELSAPDGRRQKNRDKMVAFKDQVIKACDARSR